MRTTVNIHDGLLRQARELAARTGRPLGAVLDDALRVLLAMAAEPREPVRLISHAGGGLMPGVDLEDGVALRDLLDEPESPATTAPDDRAAG